MHGVYHCMRLVCFLDLVAMFLLLSGKASVRHVGNLHNPVTYVGRPRFILVFEMNQMNHRG